MKYRSMLMFERYNNQRPEDYEGYDKARLLEYMRKKGHRRPIDVWLRPLLRSSSSIWMEMINGIWNFKITST
jgi:hypothetical protein